MSPAPTSVTLVPVPLDTMTVALPLLPSLVAVIIADPAATPVTTPLALTVAVAPLLVAHITTRPLSAFPPASLGVAVSCTVCPTVTLADAGLTATDATGTVAIVTAAGSARGPPPLGAVTREGP